QALLQMPAKNNLGWRSAVLVGDSEQSLLHERCSPTEGAVGLEADTELLMDFAQGALLEIGVKFDLVNRGRYPGFPDDPIEVSGLEVRHSDRAHPALLPKAHESPPGFGIAVHRRQRPVDKVQVETIEPQPLQRFLAGTQRGIEAVIAVTELARNE